MIEGMDVWLTLILIMARVLSFFLAAPIFGRRNVPTLAKIGLTFMLSLSTLAALDTYFAGSEIEFLSALTVEVVSGLVAGILCTWLLQSFQMGGQLIDQQSGFASATLFDPSSGTQITLFGNFLMYLSLLLFLEFNGHHFLIMGIVRSFTVVGPGEAVVSAGIMPVVIRTLITALVLMVRLAVPIMAVLIITDLTLGMVGRTVPQLNVLMLGLPVKAAVAMMVLATVSPIFLGVGESILSGIEDVFSRWLGGMIP